MLGRKNLGNCGPGSIAWDSGQRIGDILPACEGYRYIFMSFRLGVGGGT